MRTFRAHIIAFLILVLPMPSLAASLEKNEFVLSNGLKVIHIERRNVPMVVFNLLIKASSADEAPEKSGLASMAASLLTEGTKTRTSNDISSEIEFIGASLGAGAGYDYTNAYLTVLKKDLDKGLVLFSDVLLNPSFPEAEIARKRQLVKGSLKRSEEEPDFLAEKAMRKALYGEAHPYGRLASGSAETLDSLTRNDMVSFHRDYYRPNNSVLAVVGDITPDELSAALEKYLSGWQRADIPKRPDIASAPSGNKEIRITKDLTQANIVIAGPAVARSHPDVYAIRVMNYILGGGGFASRLMNRVRDEMGLAYDIHSYFDYSALAGHYEIGVQTRADMSDTVIDEIAKQVQRIQKEPVADAELQDAKDYLVGSFPRGLETMGKIASFVLSVEFYGLGDDYIEKFPSYVNSVTKEDVRRVARERFRESERYTVIVGPEGKGKAK